MKHTTAMMYQIIGWFKGFLAAFMLPLTIILWFFGIVGLLVCGGVKPDKDEEDFTDALANAIERGWNRLKTIFE